MMWNMLDDLEKISDIDKSSMLDTLAQFPEQIKETIEIAKTADIDYFIKIDNVIVTGMGGSGIAGDPYVIEDLSIVTTDNYGIYIRDTTVNLIIKDCFIDASNFAI